jgi:hypothetical protein
MFNFPFAVTLFSERLHRNGEAILFQKGCWLRMVERALTGVSKWQSA